MSSVGPVRFPAMRDEVVSALRSLSDGKRQESWGAYDPVAPQYEDLTLIVHALYDDCQVLPDPSSAVPNILKDAEVEALRRLGVPLGQLLDELDDASDARYLADPRWPLVMSAARYALLVMEG